MMETINIRYIFNRMLHWLWLAVLVAAVLAGSYYGLEKIKLSKAEKEASSEYIVGSENDPKVARYAYYRILMDESAARAYMGDNIVSYRNSMGDFIRNCAQNSFTAYQLYDSLLNSYPEIDASKFTVQTMRNCVHISREDVYIIVKADPLEITPDMLQAGTSQDTSAEGMQALNQSIRDTLVDCLTEMLENGKVFESTDFKVEACDDSLVKYAAQDDYLSSINAKDGNVSKKKVLLFFLLGGVLVEGVVFLFAAFNNTVKDTADIEANTDISVWQTVEKAGKNHTTQPDYTAAAARLIAQNGTQKTYILMPADHDEGAAADAAGHLGEALTRMGKAVFVAKDEKTIPEGEKADIVLLPVKCMLEDANSVLLSAKGQIILVLRQYKSSYPALQKMARDMTAIEANVCGAVLVDYHKEKYEL